MLTKKNIKYIYPLSPMQEGMFFHFLYDRSSSAYFEQMALRLTGKLDITLVKKSLDEVVKRHDILRTVFIHKKADRPLQVVLKEREVTFYYEDISKMEDKEAYITQYKAKNRQTLFDLTRDALMRFSVLQLSPTEFEFAWSHHHILMDGWCMGMIIADFFEIYNSHIQNRPSRLKPVKPYRVFIEWLEKQDKKAAQKYWANYLAGYEEPATIPKARFPLEGKKEYKKQKVTVTLDPAASNRLNDMAGRKEVTLNTIVQAIWGIVVSKYSGKQDMVFGTVVSGRPSEIDGVETMVGLFINTIPVRIRYENEFTFNQLLQTIQEEAVKSEPFHNYSLAAIQAQSSPKQELLEHIFVFENFPLAEKLDGAMEANKEEDRDLKFNISKG
ncbi:MAG: non-ribosomal peptide synthetase, partial [bacterium]|nr:non-ribosomal peptide synthetase [bacterium]